MLSKVDHTGYDPGPILSSTAPVETIDLVHDNRDITMMNVQPMNVQRVLRSQVIKY